MRRPAKTQRPKPVKPMESFRRPLVFSLLLHSLIFLPLVINLKGCGVGRDGQQQGEQGQGEAQQDQDKPGQEPEDQKPIEVSIIPAPPKDAGEDSPQDALEDGLTLEQRAPHAKSECKYWFGGIGVTVSQVITYKGYQVQVISQVHPGYPAAKAGLGEWDLLMNFRELRGEPGTRVDIKILRDGKPMTITTYRDKICTDAPPGGQ